MKSELFRKLSIEEVAYPRLMSALSSDEKVFDIIFDYLKSLDDYRQIDPNQVEKIADSINFAAKEVVDLVGILIGFLELLTRHDDKIDDVLDDMIEDSKGEFSLGEKERARLNRFDEIRDNYLMSRQRGFAKVSGNKVFLSMSTSVALKPVLEKRYDNDTDKIDEYEPKMNGFVPVVMIEIKRREDETSYAFQMSKAMFAEFLNDLLALRIELEQVEKICDDL